MNLSILEIYNEEVVYFIPIPSSRERLQLFNDPIHKTRVNVKGSGEIPQYKNEAYQILEKGAAKELLQLIT